MINGHFGYSRKIFSFFLRCAFSLTLLFAATGGVALAQTPHSVARTCGYVGGPVCPSQLPIIGQWTFVGQCSYSQNIPSDVKSVSQIDSWWEGYMSSAASVCSTADIGRTEGPGLLSPMTCAGD